MGVRSFWSVGSFHGWTSLSLFSLRRPPFSSDGRGILGFGCWGLVDYYNETVMIILFEAYKLALGGKKSGGGGQRAASYILGQRGGLGRRGLEMADEGERRGGDSAMAVQEDAAVVSPALRPLVVNLGVGQGEVGPPAAALGPPHPRMWLLLVLVLVGQIVPAPPLAAQRGP